jgi:hypothetical protein
MVYSVQLVPMQSSNHRVAPTQTLTFELIVLSNPLFAFILPTVFAPTTLLELYSLFKVFYQLSLLKARV